MEIGSKPVTFKWDATGLINEKEIKNERQHSSIFYCEMEADRDANLVAILRALRSRNAGAGRFVKQRDSAGSD